LISAVTILRLVFSSGVALVIGGLLLVLSTNNPETEIKALLIPVISEPERDHSDIRQETEEIGVLPDFSSIADIKQRKKQFLAFLGPIVHSENARTLAQRQRLVHLWQLHRLEVRIAQQDKQWLSEICQEYKVDLIPDASSSFWMELLARVDVVPVSLALIQAANESGWGTSRFACEGNNLFGQWYFAREGGMIPLERGEDQNHKLAQFDSINAAVRSYFRNLNTGAAYREFRQLRADCRSQGRSPDAWSLVGGLIRYSEQGQTYIDLLRQMLRNNQSLLELESNL